MVFEINDTLTLEITNESRFTSFLNDGVVKLNDLLFRYENKEYGIFPCFIWGEDVLPNLPIFFDIIFDKFGKDKWYMFESSNEAFNLKERTIYESGNLVDTLKQIFNKNNVDFKQFVYFSGDMNVKNKNYEFTNISALFMFHHNNFKPIEWNNNRNFDKTFLFLNKEPKDERYIVYTELKKLGVLDNAYYSFNAVGNPKYNESISLENKPINVTDSWVDLSNYYTNSFCSIISESEFYSNKINGYAYNSISITEKTARALNMYHPFVMIGCKHSLKFLHSIGIQTFGDIWDESYDNEEDDTIRLQKIVDTINYINTFDTDKLKNIYLYIEERLINNRNIFLSLKNKKYNYQYFLDEPFKHMKSLYEN